MRRTLLLLLAFFATLSLKAEEISSLKSAIIKQMLSNNENDKIVGKIADRYFPDGENIDLCLMEFVAHEIPDDKLVAEKINAASSDGSWSYIDYESKSRSAWSPLKHIQNIVTLSRAYKSKDSKYYNNSDLLNLTLKAIDYWCENRPICPNWWHNQIGVPKFLAPVLILLENDMSPELLAKAIKILDAAKIGMTGQNRVWLSGIVFMKGLLLSDKDLLAQSSKAITDEMKISRREGIQPDYSFQQHGAQIQFGNYGLAFASSISYWMRIFDGTEYDFSPAQRVDMRNYMLKGLRNTIWRGAMDVSSCGRQLFVNSMEGKAGSLLISTLNMMEIDNEYKDEYQKYISSNFVEPYSNEIVENIPFQISKYTIHRAKDFFFSVKMCSKTIIGGETTNQENLKGYHLSDGATMIYTTGGEYSNIFPVWNGKYMPGTTVAYNDKPLKILKGGEYLNGSDFVGGVNDGIFGVSAMCYDREGVKANKSWFFFEDYVVCMGNGITSENGETMVTTLNQCNFQDKMSYSKGKKAVGSAKGIEYMSQSVVNDGIGYKSLDDSKINFSVMEQKGDWHDVAMFYPSKTETDDIFTARIFHEAGKVGEYGYVVYPNVDDSFLTNSGKEDFEVSQNDENATVLESKKDGVVMIVFWKAGEVKTKLAKKVECDKPTMVVIRKNKVGKVVKTTYSPEL